MNIPKLKRCCLTLRTSDGSDVVTDEMVVFQGEPPYIVTWKNLAFKKTYESSSTIPHVVYTQVFAVDFSSVVVTNHG